MVHKRKTAVMVTGKNDWETPKELYDLLDNEFGFWIDAACTEKNKMCLYGYTKEKNAMYQSWYEDAMRIADGATEYPALFMNPPYSNGMINHFMAKALEESEKGAVIVCLVPVQSDAAWWHDYVMSASEIRFIRGRVKYIGYDENGKRIKNSPMFASCIVVFAPREPEEKDAPPRIVWMTDKGC
jgi:site-specific DNA-methyltransferase (adenine-specific)